MKKTKTFFLFLFSILILALLAVFSFKTGSINVSYERLFRGLFVEFDYEVAAIYDLRFPRILISIIAGASIAASGVMLQAVMQNHLVDPGIIGISSCAKLFSTLILLIFPKLFFLSPIFSVAGGIISYLLIYSLAWEEGANPTKLILVGIALNFTFIGMEEALKVFSGGNLTNVQKIIEGNISQRTWTDVKILYIYASIFLILSFFTIRPLNLLSLSDATQKSIGINVNKNRFLTALIGIILASISTAIVGIVGFLGLIVPHMGRLFVGCDHKKLLPFSMLLGSIIFLLSDTVGRIVASPFEIKPEILMSIFGGIFFILLLKFGGKSYGN